MNRPALLIIHQPCAPILRPQDTRAYPNWCVREATVCFSTSSTFIFYFFFVCGGGGYALFTSLLPRLASTSRPARRCTPSFALPISAQLSPEPRWTGGGGGGGETGPPRFDERTKIRTVITGVSTWGSGVPSAGLGGATADLVSGTRKRGAPLLTVAAQPDWRSVSRSSHAVCVRGDPVDITAPGRTAARERERGRRDERVAQNRRAHGFHGNNSWKRSQSAWIVRLRPLLIWLTTIPKQNKNVYRAAGRALGFFCFRYKAQLKSYRRSRAVLSLTHTLFFFFFFWKTNFFESGKWVSESVGTFPCNHNGTCYVNQ